MPTLTKLLAPVLTGKLPPPTSAFLILCSDSIWGREFVSKSLFELQKDFFLAQFLETMAEDLNVAL